MELFPSFLRREATGISPWNSSQEPESPQVWTSPDSSLKPWNQTSNGCNFNQQEGKICHQQPDCYTICTKTPPRERKLLHKDSTQARRVCKGQQFTGSGDVRQQTRSFHVPRTPDRASRCPHPTFTSQLCSNFGEETQLLPETHRFTSRKHPGGPRRGVQVTLTALPWMEECADLRLLVCWHLN